MLLAAIAGLLVLAAGVAILSVIITLGVHDALRRFHHDVLALDTAFAHVFGAKTERDRLMHGTLGFFLAAWACVVAFLIAWQLPLVREVTHNSVAVAAAFFGLALYLALMIVFLPIFRLGAFGRGHHRLVPYWGALFVAVFVASASILVALSL